MEAHANLTLRGTEMSGMSVNLNGCYERRTFRRTDGASLPLAEPPNCVRVQPSGCLLFRT
jgi:hypothetical protein